MRQDQTSLVGTLRTLRLPIATLALPTRHHLGARLGRKSLFN
jgi:hypothetical protein